MKIKDYVKFTNDCLTILGKSISEDYVRYIYTAISGDLIEDVETSADENYSIDDIRLAIGRVLCNRLGIDV